MCVFTKQSKERQSVVYTRTSIEQSMDFTLYL